MIRSTEAVIASVIMLGTIVYLFNVPETKAKDPTEQYIKSVLDSYSDTIKFLALKDPYTLVTLIDASMPNGYSERVVINYFRKYIAFTGTDEVPVENYVLMPSQGKSSLPDSEIKSNWYQSLFRVTNTGSQKISGITSISVSLYKPAPEGSGITYPIDADSIMVFTDDGKLNSTVTRYEDYYDRTIVGLLLDLSAEPGEAKNMYVYYLIGDDYE